MNAAAHGGNHASGDRVTETEGVADGDDRLSGHDVGRIAQRKFRKILRAFKLQHSNIKIGVSAAQCGLELAPVIEPHDDIRTALNYVSVGQH